MQLPQVSPPRQPGWRGVLTIDLSRRLGSGLTVSANPMPQIIVASNSGVSVLAVQPSGTSVLAELSVSQFAVSPSNPMLTLVYAGSDGILFDPVSFVLPIEGPNLQNITVPVTGQLSTSQSPQGGSGSGTLQPPTMFLASLADIAVAAPVLNFSFTGTTAFATSLSDSASSSSALTTVSAGASAIADSVASGEAFSPSIPPPPGTLQAVVTIQDTYTRLGITQQASGTYTFNESTGTTLAPWVDPNGQFTLSRVASRVAGCLLRVYFVRTAGWQSVEFELGDWRGTGLGATDRNGNPVPLSLNRYNVTISDNTGTLATFNLTSNGCPPQTTGWLPCAHGWLSGWRWTSGPWPFTRSIASLVATNLLPAMSTGAVPQNSSGGPGPFTYPPANPNYILGMSYGPGVTGTDDAIAGMMQGVHGSYCENENPTDLATMLAVSDSGHNFPMILRDLNTEALADFWTTPSFVPTGSSEPQYWALLDVLLTNTTGATITVPNGNGSFFSYVADTGGQTYVIGNDQGGPNNPPIVLPPGGTQIVTCVLYFASEPTGTPSVYTDNNGTHITYPGLTASYVANSLSRGSGSGNDSSHNPPFAFVPFLVTGDPYHLTGVHALAVNAAFAQCNPSFPSNGAGYHANGRISAWSLRDVMNAAQATPSTAPPWMIAKASFQKTVDAVRVGMNYVQTNPASPTQTTFFSMYDDHAYNDEAWWQEDYIHQAVTWCAMVYPNTQWETVLDWLIRQPIARLNGASGWCNLWPVYYKQAYGPSQGVWYADWASMFAGNASFPPGTNWGLPAGTTCTGNADINGGPDYVGGLYAAVALAIQAGNKQSTPPAWLSSAGACKTFLIGQIQAALASSPTYAISRKHGFS